MREFKFVKCLFLSFLVSFGAVHKLYSQDKKQIDFLNISLKKAVKKANTYKKILFIDLYSLEDGRHEWMIKNIYNKKVASKFCNDNFVCVSYEFQSEDGQFLLKKYGVEESCILFVDDKYNLLQMASGMIKIEKDFVELGIRALNPYESFTSYHNKDTKKPNDQNTYNYLKALKKSRAPYDKATKNYLKTLSDKDLHTKYNLMIIYEFVNDIDSREFKFLIKNKKEFCNLYESKKVDYKIYKTLSVAANNFILEMERPNDKVYNDFKEKLKKYDYDQIDKVFFVSDAEYYNFSGKMEKYKELLFKDLMIYFPDNWLMLNNYAWVLFIHTDDKETWQQCKKWVAKSVKLKSRPENNDTYANILYALGNKKEAVIYEEKAVKMAEMLNFDNLDSYKKTLLKFKQGK